MQVILAVAGLSLLFTVYWIVGILMLICSRLVYDNKEIYTKNDWKELYSSQNRAGKRKMKADLKKNVLGKKKFR